MPSPTEFAAIVGAIAGIVALSKAGLDTFKQRKRTKKAVEEALDHQPEVKRQLELGNVGEAVKHLNAIIDSQARHIDRLEQDYDSLRTENKDLRAENRVLRERLERVESQRTL